MLAKEYQDYMKALVRVAVAEIKAKGKFSTSRVRSHSLSKAAAAKASAYTVSKARIKKSQTAKFINGELEDAIFASIKRVLKRLKKEGLAFLPVLPAAVVATPAIAKAPEMDRRSFVKAASFAGGAVVFSGALLSPGQAYAGDKAFAASVAADIASFAKGMEASIASAITG